MTAVFKTAIHVSPVSPKTDHYANGRNRALAEQRRSVRRTVSEHRERLAEGVRHPVSFDYELLLAYARNRTSAGLALLTLAVLVAGIAILWVEPMHAAIWGTGVIVSDTLAVMVCRRFARTAQEGTRFKTWRVRFVAVELFAGFAWSLLFVIPQVTAQPGLETYHFAAMLLLMAAMTAIASTVPAVAVAATAPITLALIVSTIIGGTVTDFFQAAMAIAAAVFFIVLLTRIYSATFSMLEYRAEKDLLIAELGTAKAISDEARRRAEEANLAKSRFLATMSHELRTPLNAILGFSEIIKKELLGPVGNESYKEYVSDIHDSGHHLLNLINEILDLSRIEAGRYELNEQPVDLAAVAADCRRLMQVKAQEKGITVTERYVPDLPKLWADERALRQIALNLLSNALKFTPSGGKVTLTVSPTDQGGQSLSVADNGPGIPEEEIPIVLSSFGQAAIAANETERGAGLGLPIVQALATTHDGSFELSSKLRVGTTATAIFPATRVMQALPPVGADRRPYQAAM